jgi:hypothetical protein
LTVPANNLGQGATQLQVLFRCHCPRPAQASRSLTKLSPAEKRAQTVTSSMNTNSAYVINEMQCGSYTHNSHIAPYRTLLNHSTLRQNYHNTAQQSTCGTLHSLLQGCRLRHSWQLYVLAQSYVNVTPRDRPVPGPGPCYPSPQLAACLVDIVHAKGRSSTTHAAESRMSHFCYFLFTTCYNIIGIVTESHTSPASCPSHGKSALICCVHTRSTGDGGASPVTGVPAGETQCNSSSSSSSSKRSS